jgi:hypothetical protein
MGMPGKLGAGPKLPFLRRCDSGDTFESIVAKPLQAVGADLIPTGLTRQRSLGGKGSLKVPIAELGLDKSRQVTETFRVDVKLSPATVAEALGDLEGILVVDEADAIKNDEDKHKLAELVKHLSDGGSPLKVLLVGIAETATELTAAHPSVQRCLKEMQVRRMEDDELRQIVQQGAEKLNLVFEQRVIDAIVRLSSGYPYFTHLLALKCAEGAVGLSASPFFVFPKRVIKEQHLVQAMRLAVEDAEGTLRHAYDNAIRSNSEMYRTILVAAASLGGEFKAGELRDAIKTRTGIPISQAALNNYFTRLVSSDGSTVLRRVAKGFYRFQDPRMLSYVRIVNGTANGDTLVD